MAGSGGGQVMAGGVAEWYVQKGARVQGPFSAAEMGRFLMIGRVRRTDRVSRDGEVWEPVTQVPELVPEALLDLESPDGWRRFVRAREEGDERGAAGDDREVGPGIRIERRAEADVLRRVREEWVGADAPHPTPPRVPVRGNLLPWSLLCLTLAALGVVLWLDRAAFPAG